MSNRRRFLQSSLFGALGLGFGKRAAARPFRESSHSFTPLTGQPVVISTWDEGIAANRGAWEVLGKNGRALDAVEAGVKVTEASQNCCVGLGARPDRDGHVTLDACIMDESGNCGSVGCVERIRHPISVARRVMEKTPHVMLVGEGAQQFAVAEGFPLENPKLSEEAEKAYKDWLKKSEYKPVINIENSKAGQGNHDTIGMVAMDAAGDLSGSCTTSGMAFKMRGRLGDSPIIGAGLFVDNEVGAATATGQGEDVIRISGSHTVVELMRQGLSPMQACQAAVERIIRVKKEKVQDIQVAFLALNKKGEIGAYAIHPGFSYAVKTKTEEKLVQSESWSKV